MHAASKYRSGDGALTDKLLPAANAPGRCLACARLSGIVAIALVVIFEFELEQRTLEWSITLNSGAAKHLLELPHPLPQPTLPARHTCRSHDPVRDWLCGCCF